MVVSAVPAIRVRVRGTKNVQHRAGCHRREAMHVATISRIEDGSVARSGEVGVDLNFGQPNIVCCCDCTNQGIHA